MPAAPQLSTPRLQRPSSPLFLAALAAALTLPASAHATSIVADAGFEAAGGGNIYFAGQTIDAGAWTVLHGSVYVDTLDPYVYDGANSLNLTYVNPYASNSLSQVLSTIAGQTYLVNFWANADTPNTFALTENGTALTGAPSSIVDNGFPGATNSGLFKNYSASFLATSTNTALNLTATGNPPIGSSVGSVMIDDLSVQPAPVPEPGSIVLVLTGIVGLGETVRRKRPGKATSRR